MRPRAVDFIGDDSLFFPALLLTLLVGVGSSRIAFAAGECPGATIEAEECLDRVVVGSVIGNSVAHWSVAGRSGTIHLEQEAVGDYTFVKIEGEWRAGDRLWIDQRLRRLRR